MYLNLLTEFVIPQLGNLQPNVFFQQDGAPLHWGRDGRNFFYETLWLFG